MDKRRYQRSRQDSFRVPPRYNKQMQSWWERRADGYGINLYRNVRRKKVAGVCAGLADHFNVDHWVIRLAAIGAFLFFNSLAFFAYIAAWIALKPRPKKGSVNTQYRYDEDLQEDRPVNMFRYRSNPSERLSSAKERLAEIVERVNRMETYVTSKRFELDKEFSKIQD